MGYKLYLTEEQVEKLLQILRYWNGDCTVVDPIARRIETVIQNKLSDPDSDPPYIREWWLDDFK